MMLQRLLNAMRRQRSCAAEVTIKNVLDSAHQLQSAGNLIGARQALMAGIAQHPAAAELINNLGLLDLAERDFVVAESHFQRALQLRPGLAEAHCNLGIVWAELGNSEGSRQAFQRAIELDPQLLSAHENCAVLLARQGDDEAALAAWSAVLALSPAHAEAQAAKGILLVRVGAFAEARMLFQEARQGGLKTQGLALQEAVVEAAIGDTAAARTALEVLRENGDSVEIDWQLSLLHLSQGDFANGWPLYEARLQRQFESPRSQYPFPEWNGTPLADSTLLIIAEQGLGDEIMFASCYSDAIARAPCVIECDPRLASLFTRSFPQARVVAQSRSANHDWLRQYPDIRHQIHAGSLPHLFRADWQSFPAHGGYLHADVSRVDDWRAQLKALGPGRKVGISWSGGLRQTRRALRSVPLADFAGLLLPGVHYVSLQHDDDGSQARELAQRAGIAVQVYPEALANLDEMAALVNALDQVITVCSSVAHLVGALGRPAAVMVPAVPEWRYLRSGDRMPWYPSLQLWRQQPQEKWQPMIRRMAQAIT